MGKNLKELPAITSWEPDDLLYTVRPGLADAEADKQISVSNAFANLSTYGQLYMDINTTPGAISTDATPVPVDIFDNAAPLKDMTADLGTGSLTVGAGQGTEIYRATFSASFDTTTNTNYAIAIYINGAISSIAAVADMNNNAADSVNLSAGGLVSLTGGNTVDMRVWSTVAGAVTFESAILSLSKV